MRETMLNSMIAYMEGKREKHKANLEIYLSNPAGIGEHPDVMEALESEMKQIAECNDILEVIGDLL